jgi:hypothetical protein
MLCGDCLEGRDPPLPPPAPRPGLSAAPGQRCRVCGERLVERVVSEPQRLPTEDVFNVFDAELRQLIEQSLQSQRPNRIVDERTIESMGTLVVDQRGMVLMDAVVQIGDLTLCAVPAAFSSAPMGSVHGRIVIGEPIYGESEATAECKSAANGQILVLQRGKVSFAQKVAFAEKVNAAALIVVQTEGYKYPFLMTDSAAELKTLIGIETAQMPVLMISASDWELAREYLARTKTPLGSIQIADPLNKDCAICCEKLDEGAEVLRLGCRHCYHSACLAQWLRRQNNCPLCRSAVARTQKAEKEKSRIEHFFS